MRKICEWSKCKEIASGEGLIKKDINKQYKWFCGDHLKIHNKTNDNSCDWKRCKQAGEFKAPSKTVGEYKWFCSEHIKIYNHEWDFFSEMSQDKIEEFIHSDITWHKPTSKRNVKWSEIREQFKKLVKKYHPDTNSGDKKFENKLKEITIAYTLLRNNQKNVNHGQ